VTAKRLGHPLIAAVLTSVAAAALAPTAAQAATTVALWHMNETSGSSMLDSARGHTGTLHSVKLGLPGFSGFAYGFNGSSSYVSVPTASDLNPGGATLTVTIRLKTTSLPPPEDWDLFRKGYFDTKGGEWKVEYYPSGQASCGFKGGKDVELIAGPKLNNGAWHTITCVKTASSISLTVDGRTFSQGGKVGSIANTSPVVIGARPGSEFFQGSLDEAAIQIG